ncbi:MAG: AAA family ATPase [Bacteroidaceae bacterium]|nr:AAA family ATPase [Bacteroidaceae bacterium]MDO4994054.1 AAA family ATPase [Bacteroidales bacterium]
MENITKVVLTGGPCAGKTTALVRIIEHFSSHGFKVFTIPEVPTLFTQAGMNYLTKNQSFFYEGEKATLEIQLALEDKFLRMAQECDQPCLIVCDRGAMDISAYMAPKTWADITRSVGTTTPELRDRYDAVLHLVSAADGAEQYYTTANNAQRYEQMNEEGLRIARSLDKKVIRAWTGHPHLRVINNHDDFDAKMNRVIKEISNVLGLPQPIVEERKYIIELTGDLPEDSILSEITQTYLQAEPGTEVRLRKRGWDQKQVYVHTTKKKISASEELVTERQINNSLYEMMLGLADPTRHTIRKRRNSFIWKGQYFEVDTYQDRLQGLVILETKGIVEGEPVKFPPFLNVIQDITGNEEYYNYNLAKR